MTVEPGLPPPQTPPASSPPSPTGAAERGSTGFEQGLAAVLSHNRYDLVLTDTRFAMIVIGFLHSYVQSLAVRAAAETAVDMLEKQYPNEKYRAPPARAYVETVIASVMEVKL